MGNFVDKVKTGFWNLLNSPGTDPVDEEHEDGYYEEEQEDYGYRTSRDNSRGYGRGRVHEDGDYDEYGSAPLQPRWGDKRVTSARQAQNNKILEMHGKTGPPKAEIVVRRPMNVEDSCKICNMLCDEKICVVDLTGMERSMAQRIADFLGGACYALSGTVHRVSRDIFIIVPDGVRITAEMQDEMERDGYVFPAKARR
ncbi:MAG: cell division protein SepF [Defluviitaleaceae bacterium]|nr:cell division protein SepF [Defluviitaleaceae bacterium]